jgi:cytochrome b involved in lipid metabolism
MIKRQIDKETFMKTHYERKKSDKLLKNYYVNFGPRDEMFKEVATEDPQPSLVWAIGGLLTLLVLIATFWM